MKAPSPRRTEGGSLQIRFRSIASDSLQVRLRRRLDDVAFGSNVHVLSVAWMTVVAIVIAELIFGFGIEKFIGVFHDSLGIRVIYRCFP